MAYIILEEEQEDDEYEYGDACREEPEGFPLSKTGSTGVGNMAVENVAADGRGKEEAYTV